MSRGLLNEEGLKADWLRHHSATTLKKRRAPLTPLTVRLVVAAVAVRELPEIVVQVLRLLE